MIQSVIALMKPHILGAIPDKTPLIVDNRMKWILFIVILSQCLKLDYMFVSFPPYIAATILL